MSCGFDKVSGAVWTIEGASSLDTNRSRSSIVLGGCKMREGIQILRKHKEACSMKNVDDVADYLEAKLDQA